MRFDIWLGIVLIEAFLLHVWIKIMVWQMRTVPVRKKKYPIKFREKGDNYPFGEGEHISTTK